MEIKADLHNHLKTAGRKPFDISFDETIDIVAKRLGPKGIFGVVGFDDLRYEDFIGLRKTYDVKNLGNAVYIPSKEILIVKGQEVFTKNGHLLVLGMKENQSLKNKRSLEDSLKEAEDDNTIIIPTHPFFMLGSGNYLIRNYRLLKYIHGFEIFNGEAFYGNKKAKIFYDLFKEDYNIGAISSSDGHSLKEIGSSYTFLDWPNIENSDKLVESLRKTIKKHKNYSKDKQHFSFLGFLGHSMKTITNPTSLKPLSE